MHADRNIKKSNCCMKNSITNFNSKVNILKDPVKIWNGTIAI